MGSSCVLPPYLLSAAQTDPAQPEPSLWQQRTAAEWTLSSLQRSRRTLKAQLVQASTVIAYGWSGAWGGWAGEGGGLTGGGGCAGDGGSGTGSGNDGGGDSGGDRGALVTTVVTETEAAAMAPVVAAAVALVLAAVMEVLHPKHQLLRARSPLAAGMAWVHRAPYLLRRRQRGQ